MDEPLTLREGDLVTFDWATYPNGDLIFFEAYEVDGKFMFREVAQVNPS